MREDCRAVLRAKVRALTIHLRWVVHIPKGVDESLVADLGRVESDLDDFGVAGFFAADVLVRRVLRVAIAVADRSVNYSWDHSEFDFDSPEATGRESSSFCHGIPFLFFDFILTRIVVPIRCFAARKVSVKRGLGGRI